MVAGVIVLAVVNAIVFPVELERQILIHPRAGPLVQAATQCEGDATCWAAASVGLSSNPFSMEAQLTCPAPDTLRRYVNVAVTLHVDCYCKENRFSHALEFVT